MLVLITIAMVSAKLVPPIFHISLQLVTTPNANCDSSGVCTLDSKDAKAKVLDLEAKIVEDWNSSHNDTNGTSESQGKIEELKKLGWTEEESKAALEASSYDLEKALEALEKEEEAVEALAAQVNEVVGHGWSKEAAASAVVECSGNITESLALLEKEEENIRSQFEGSVKDMVGYASLNGPMFIKHEFYFFRVDTSHSLIMAGKKLWLVKHCWPSGP